MSFTVSGFFGIANGRQESVTSTANKTTTYVTYDTSFQCLDGSSGAAIIRHFSPRHAILTDNTVVFLLAKAGFPLAAHDTTVLHALYFHPIPGDASGPDYENTVPDMPIPIANIVGHVSTALSPAAEYPKKFVMATSSYVGAGSISSFVTCIFANTRRWANAPNISMNSCLAVIGSFSSITSSNELSIAVDDVTLNLSQKVAVTAVDAPSATSKRKFSPYAVRPITTDPSSSSTPVTRMLPPSTYTAEPSPNPLSTIDAGDNPTPVIRAEEVKTKRKRSTMPTILVPPPSYTAESSSTNTLSATEVSDKPSPVFEAELEDVKGKRKRSKQ